MKVSILIPAYNAAAFLPKCLDSVLNQTYQDLQVVIVDDGSKDKTLEVCHKYAEKDSRIEVYHQENQGVAATRNHLLEKVKGDYVLFVDADDWIELDMVEYLVSLATELDAEMVMCDRVINDAKPSDKKPEVNILPQEEAIKDFLYHDYFVGSLWNKLLSRSLLHNEQFHRGISYGEDALFIWGALQKVNNVVVSDKQLYHYYMNEESISHQTFGDKKLTGHLTWTLITEDVAKRWPQFLDIAKSSFGLQDMYLLRAASQSGYKKNDEIKKIQITVKTYLPQILSRKKLGVKDRIYTQVICRWYGFGKLYYALNKLKRNVR